MADSDVMQAAMLDAINATLPVHRVDAMTRFVLARRCAEIALGKQAGACGDPMCVVLHADPSNPIHPPFYEDSRVPHSAE